MANITLILYGEPVEISVKDARRIYKELRDIFEPIPTVHDLTNEYHPSIHGIEQSLSDDVILHEKH